MKSNPVTFRCFDDVLNRFRKWFVFSFGKKENHSSGYESNDSAKCARNEPSVSALKEKEKIFQSENDRGKKGEKFLFFKITF